MRHHSTSPNHVTRAQKRFLAAYPCFPVYYRRAKQVEHCGEARAIFPCQDPRVIMYITETARLGLRRLRGSDLDDFHEIWSNPNAIQWTSYGVSRTLEDSQICLDTLSPSPEKPEPHNYGVFLRGLPCSPLAGRMIGIVGTFRSTGSEAGYIFNESFWGQGYASEALAAFLKIHWQRITADPSLPQEVSARVDPDNPASVRVLRKCGFRDVGLLVVDGKDLLLLQVDKPVKS